MHALQNHVERLAEDHALAKDLAERLHSFEALSCDPLGVETNLVVVTLNHPDHSAASLSAKLGEEGVRVLPMGDNILRFVTHMDVGPEDVDKLHGALSKILEG